MNKNLSLVLTICFACMMFSCGSSENSDSSDNSSEDKLQDEQLSSFMLGGIYFINGYGGVDQIKNIMSSNGYTSDEELIDGYKQMLEFPFKTSEGSDSKRMLKSAWSITDKKSLMATLDDLKTRDYKYKAWDYARIVNNACMGYSAGYMTKDEVTSYIKDILPLARDKYDSWDAYFKDFDLGRKDWRTRR